MKKININKLFVVAALSTMMLSCSEDAMDKINDDINHTKDVPAKFILADVITSTAFYNIGGDIGTYTSIYVEHEAGIHNQMYRAEHREGEPSSSSTFNNAWGNVYGSLKNARIIIAKCSEGGSQEGNLITKGIAEVLAAYNSALLADMFGDTPFSEAAFIKPDLTPLFMNPKVDKQEEIYKGIMQYLDNAIQDLQGSDSHVSGPVRDFDFMYKGDAKKWIKFAYGLKARYTMRLIKRTSDVNAEMNKVVEYTSKSFTSADEQAAFAMYNKSNLNPLFDFQWSRDALASSESIAEKLIERKDPRLHRVFIDVDWTQLSGDEDPNWYPSPNGTNNELQYHYNTSAFVFSQTAPTLFLSYHEILFLKAEALCRLGKIDEAEIGLQAAVVAGIANTEINVNAAMNAPTILGYGGLGETSDAITTEEATEYFAKNVVPLFKANPLKEVMIQKYLAFFGASSESTECYNDIRRMMGLGENFVTLKNPKKFPLRCPYGADDTTNNPYVQEAFGDGQYVYSEPVWWAGGTR